jgi:beta-glucosidase-like glycosyl hydrolase
VAALLRELTWPEKLAQLQGLWLGADDGGQVAPEMDSAAPAGDFPDFARHGLGHLTRLYGTKPIPPAEGLARLIGYQRWLLEHTRTPIGALAHEECLTGLAAWGATTYPTPLAWAATFDPQLVETMAAQIGATMAALGVRQGLAPVLDVVVDARWGRVEETMGEDPYLVGTLGAAYVRGLQSAGVAATLKHFLSYSASQAGRNLAPVHAGPREALEVFAPAFEPALRLAGAQSVMPAYVDLDGLPLHADGAYLTDLLRQQWGFTGVVVSDYFGVEFLERQHHLAADLAGAARTALAAGVDVELPTGVAYQALADVDPDPALAAAVDRALTRVLSQKEALGLLDLEAEIARLEALAARAPDSLDPPAHRAQAARMAEAAIVLLANPTRPAAGRAPSDRPRPDDEAAAHARPDAAQTTTQDNPDGVGAGDHAAPAHLDATSADTAGDDHRGGSNDTSQYNFNWVGAGDHGAPATAPDPAATAQPLLPLFPRPGLRLAVVGPNADRSAALFGCYSFVNHVLAHHLDVPSLLDSPTVLQALRQEYEPAGASLGFAPGCTVRGQDRSGLAAAVALAQDSDVVVAVVGDQSGLFGQGTSGEGCDAASLELPGLQAELLEALVAVGRPLVVVALAGRPYNLPAAVLESAALVWAFFPGEAGARAVAGVLSGRVNPGGHLPVCFPASVAALPYNYRHSQMVAANGVSAIDPTPRFSFGHGLGYTSFEFHDFAPEQDEVASDGWIALRATVVNRGGRAGDCLLQLYGADPVASVVRPTRFLAGYHKLALAPGESRTVRLLAPTDRFALVDRRLERVVEPGLVQLWLGWDADHLATEAVSVRLTGPTHRLGAEAPRLTRVEAL